MSKARTFLGLAVGLIMMLSLGLTACGDSAATVPATTSAAATTSAQTGAATTSAATSTLASTTTTTSSAATTTSVAATTTVIATTAPATTAAVGNPATFIWQSTGDGGKQLKHPFSLALDSQGNIYVGVIDTAEIQKYDKDGHFLTSWGKLGSGDGEFKFQITGATEVAVALDSKDNVYVSDLNYRIQKFDSNGKFLLKWGSQGEGEAQFRGSVSLAFDKADNIYVSDIFNNVIQKFDSNGKFLARYGGTGSGDGQFKKLAGIALDPQGNIYAVDNTLNSLQKLDSTGKFVARWGDKNLLNGPTAVAFDRQGMIYVSDLTTLYKFDPNGQLLGKWGGKGSGEGQLNIPTSIAIDGQHNLYVADWMNSRIQKFRLN